MLGFSSIALCGTLLPVLVLLIFLRVDRATKVHTSNSLDNPAGINHITTANGSDGWTYIGTKGGIETYVKKVEGSPLLAFRGVAYLDMHISKAMGPYINLTTAYDWVSMLKSIQKFPVHNARLHDGEAAEDLVYQTLELPWPVAPRDVLLHRNFHFDPVQRTVSVLYRSVHDSRAPLVPGVIRADSPHSMWRFRSLSPCEESIHTKQSPLAEPSKKHTKSSWLQRKLNYVRQRFADKKPLGVEISVKFARTQHSSSVPKKPLLAQSVVGDDVPKLPAFSALLALLTRQKGSGFESEKVRPMHTSSHPKRIQSRSESTINPIETTEVATVESEKPALHGGLAQLACKDPHALHQLSEHHHINTDSAAQSPRRPGKHHPSHHRHRGSGTVIEFESFVNSKGNIPAWFINYMQRSFPAQALSDYRKVASKGYVAPYAKVQDW